jgi:DNA-binding winged helix-turn-helix (wHTH) protein
MLFAFEGFTLDPGDRRLRRADGAPVELSARYLDALALLVGEAGRLVSKDRFLDEVWRGVPVTDEALTQCVKTLRRQLGDDAARPRFIETVPKHGYRFVAAVERIGDEGGAAKPRAGLEGHPTPSPSPSRGGGLRRIMLLGGAGTLGAGTAGTIGGLFYGFAGTAQPAGPGAASVLLVLLWLTIAAAAIGGAGVSFGIAALAPRWTIAGGALGGLIVGAVAKLLGLDAFNLLLGRSPGDITGGAEGLMLGASVGLGALLARGSTLRRGALLAALCGGAAGAAIPLLGGRLMGGSLDLLVRGFPDSRLRLDAIGALFGEAGFGPVSQAATGALEGALFAGCIVGAMRLARRSMGEDG